MKSAALVTQLGVSRVSYGDIASLSASSSVRALQTICNKVFEYMGVGIPKLAVDGIAGNKTKDALLRVFGSSSVFVADALAVARKLFTPVTVGVLQSQLKPAKVFDTVPVVVSTSPVKTTSPAGGVVDPPAPSTKKNTLMLLIGGVWLLALLFFLFRALRPR